MRATVRKRSAAPQRSSPADKPNEKVYTAGRRGRSGVLLHSLRLFLASGESRSVQQPRRSVAAEGRRGQGEPRIPERAADRWKVGRCTGGTGRCGRENTRLVQSLRSA